MKCLLIPAVLLAAIARQASAQSDSASVIQDNSFLVEEAYNQEARVVQHITTFQMQRGSHDFEAAFTQEWPVGSIRHQLSYDIPLIRLGSRTALGDVGVNYRYQLIGSGETRLAIAPRISAILPTGSWKQSFGAGGAGFEANIPVSYMVSPQLSTHTNAGVAVFPSARNAGGDRARTSEWFVGQSAILTMSSVIQPLVEFVYSRGNEVVAEDRTRRVSSAVISPGVRGALNFSSGLQIVPGMAIPVGIGPSNGDRGIFLYLSFEHPF